MGHGRAIRPCSCRNGGARQNPAYGPSIPISSRRIGRRRGRRRLRRRPVRRRRLAFLWRNFLRIAIEDSRSFGLLFRSLFRSLERPAAHCKGSRRGRRRECDRPFVLIAEIGDAIDGRRCPICRGRPSRFRHSRTLHCPRFDFTHAIEAAERPGLAIGADFAAPETPAPLAFRIFPNDIALAEAMAREYRILSVKKGGQSVDRRVFRRRRLKNVPARLEPGPSAEDIFAGKLDFAYFLSEPQRRKTVRRRKAASPGSRCARKVRDKATSGQSFLGL